jgi:hypothetical protein
MITDEILAKALSAVRGITMTTAHGYNVSPADIARCYLAAALPMIRDAVLEEAARVADKGVTFESGGIAYSIRAMKGTGHDNG